MDIIDNFGEASEEGKCGKKAVIEESSAIFELTDETVELNDLKTNDETYGKISNFLQKLHIGNHEIASKETVHEFCMAEATVDNESEFLSKEDEYLFNNVQQAMAEKDIIELRSKLRSISQSISPHQSNPENIECYLNTDPDPVKQGMMFDGSESDRLLAAAVDFYDEIDKAIGEKDIMQSRSELKSILNFESSHSWSIDEIEDYLSHELEESAITSFNNELKNNPRLATEVKLYREINEALGESDVIELRATLAKIRKISIEQGNQQKRGIIPMKLKKAIYYATVASVILLLGLNVIFRSHPYTATELYLEYYQPVKSDLAATRSVLRRDEVMLHQAMAKMSTKEYDRALELFSELLDKDKQNTVANFYIAAVYQAKGQYNDAIQSFTKVIAQGDNLFIEQAEWYLSLCYLGLNQRDKAVSQFRKISIGDGYYSLQSIALLKKLEPK